MATKLNDFKTDLEFSNSASDEPFWKEVYRRAFPDFANCMKYDQHCEGQLRGIDRIIYLKSGRVLYIDEKKRRKNYNYNDILLEYEHVFDDGHTEIGWIEKQLVIDYLAYAFMKTETVLLYDWQMLRKAWLQNKMEWHRTCDTIPAHNRGYVTHSLAIPFRVLHKAVSAERIIKL